MAGTQFEVSCQFASLIFPVRHLQASPRQPPQPEVHILENTPPPQGNSARCHVVQKFEKRKNKIKREERGVLGILNFATVAKIKGKTVRVWEAWIGIFWESIKKCGFWTNIYAVEACPQLYLQQNNRAQVMLVNIPVQGEIYLSHTLAVALFNLQKKERGPGKF